MTVSRKRYTLAYLGIVLSLLFLWLSLRQTDFAEILSSFSRSNFSLALPFLFIYAAYYWFKAWRWKLLLPNIKAETYQLFRIVVIGYAGNTVLPLRLGELVRIFIAGKRLGANYSTLLSSIAIEHIFDFIVILCTMAVLLVLYVDIPIMVTASSILAALTATAITAYVVFAKWTKEVIDFVAWVFSAMSEHTQLKIQQQLQLLAQGVKSIGQPVRLVQIFLVTLFQWAAMFCSIYISLVALNLDLPLSATLTVMAITVVAIIIPTSPGDIGAIQLAYVLALQPYGASPSDAFAASVFFHILTSVSVVALGTVYLHRLGFSMRQVRKDAEYISMDE